MTSYAFVCANEDGDEFDERHVTSTAMVRCTRCGEYGVGGYMCDTCGHGDLDPADQLSGHGEGKCAHTPPTNYREAPHVH